MCQSVTHMPYSFLCSSHPSLNMLLLLTTLPTPSHVAYWAPLLINTSPPSNYLPRSFPAFHMYNYFNPFSARLHDASGSCAVGGAPRASQQSPTLNSFNLFLPHLDHSTRSDTAAPYTEPHPYTIFPYSTNALYSQSTSHLPRHMDTQTSCDTDILPNKHTFINASDITSSSHNTDAHPTFTNHRTPGRQIKLHKPRAGCKIAGNNLRPLVTAQDWLFCWDTPYCIEQHKHLPQLVPQTLVEPILMTIQGTLAPNLKSCYAAGLLRWTQFCDKYFIPEIDRMPTSYALIVGFITEYRGHHPGGTISSWLSGVHSWHLVNHAPWHGENDPWVKFAHTTANKDGASLKRPPRSPVSIEHLICLKRALNMKNPWHAAIWAVATCTFWGCRCLGETTVSKETDFDSKFNVTRGSILLFTYTSTGEPLSASFCIPWTKSMRELRASIILTAWPDKLCPVAALKAHLNINSGIPLHASFFAYHTNDGVQFSNMIKDDFWNLHSVSGSHPTWHTYMAIVYVLAAQSSSYLQGYHLK